jgi:hypothetical protein
VFHKQLYSEPATAFQSPTESATLSSALFAWITETFVFMVAAPGKIVAPISVVS